MIAKTKQAMNKEGEDSYQTLLSKFVVSEKKLEELKVMYHHLSSNQEHLKKEKAVLEKKYKRKTDRLRAMESELKHTRE